MASAEHEIQVALAYANGGNAQAAIEALKRALGMAPDHPFAHALLAHFLTQQKRLHAALYEAREAVRLDPENPFARATLGEVLGLRQEHEEAEAHLRAACELAPEEASWRVMLAWFLWRRRRREEAAEVLDEARALAPENEEVLLAEAAFALERDPDAAREAAERLLKINPGNARGHCLLGQAALRAGEKDVAMEHALAALRLAPTLDRAHHLLVDVKASRNPLIGAWWRFAAWSVRLRMATQILVLVAAYVVARGVAVTLEYDGQARLASYVSMGWIVLVLYTWVAFGLYRRMIQRQLHPDLPKLDD